MLLGYAMQSEGDAFAKHPTPAWRGATPPWRWVRWSRYWSTGSFPAAYGPPTLGQWADWLEENVLEQFFQADPTESNDEQQVRKAIQQLRELAAHCADPVPLAPVREQLLAALEKAVTHDGYLRGSVTCCALKPLRSIPFRVICLLGMNDGAFPAPIRVMPSITCSTRAKPATARCAMRTAICFLKPSWRAEVLYLSYQGQSLQDETEFPPSVLVGELLDALDKSFQFPKGDSREKLGRVHRLQAFSPAYFDGTRTELISYSAANAQAAVCFVNGKKPGPNSS